jgi:cytolysin-activating lysine-acyltransferase
MIPPTLPNLSEAEITDLAKRLQDEAKAAAGKIPLLGPVAWLMMQQPSTKHTFLTELEWRVMPALVWDQAKLYMREGMPLAYVSWARLSKEAAMRYRAAHRLAPSDWRSGEQIWLVDVFTPFGGAPELLKDIRENVFAGQPVYQLGPVTDADGLAKVMTWPAEDAP